MTGVKEDLKTIKVALIGDDMSHGIVKDVHDLKKEKSLTFSFLKSLVAPVIVAIIVAFIVTGGHF